MKKKAAAVTVLIIAIAVMIPIGLKPGKPEVNTGEPDFSQSAAGDSAADDETETTTVPATEPAKTLTSAAPETERTEPLTTTTTTTTTETETTTTTATVTTVKETTAAATTTKPATSSESTTTAKPAASATQKQTTTKAAATTSAATTTVKKKTNAAPSGTPVSKHGQLSVKGANIVDENGSVFQLIGMSTHGIMWETFGDILSKESLKVLRDDWGCNAIRIAMYTEGWGGYTTGSDYAAQAKQKVANGVANATELGMYVIIDWHILSDGDPRAHQNEAVSFFTEMSAKYKDHNNVIYEICNEPNGGASWSGSIKPYAEAVISAIRSSDKDAVVICGTGTWSQDIHQVLGNTLSDKNTVYALHFYANSHTDSMRNRLRTCYEKGLPVLVSEFGTCDASGNGGYNASQSQKWFDLLDELNVGYLNWSAANKNETASAFVSGTNLSAIKAGESQLTESGRLVRKQFRKRAGLE